MRIQSLPRSPWPVHGAGLPINVLLTEGQARGNPQLLPLLEKIGLRSDGPGRPCSAPESVLVDKA